MPKNSSITSFNALQPIVVRTIREAFENAVGELEQRHGADMISEDTRIALSRTMVRLARSGECDPARLQVSALTTVRL